MNKKYKRLIISLSSMLCLSMVSCANNSNNTSHEEEIQRKWIWESAEIELEEEIIKKEKEYYDQFISKTLYQFNDLNNESEEYSYYVFNRNLDFLKELNYIIENNKDLIKIQKYKENQIKFKPTEKINNSINKLKIIIEQEKKQLPTRFLQEILWNTLLNLLHETIVEFESETEIWIEQLLSGEAVFDKNILIKDKFFITFIEVIKKLEQETKIIMPSELRKVIIKYEDYLDKLKFFLKKQNQDFNLLINEILEEEWKIEIKKEIEIDQNNGQKYNDYLIMYQLIERMEKYSLKKFDLIWINQEIELNYLIEWYEENFIKKYKKDNDWVISEMNKIIYYYKELEILSKKVFPENIKILIDKLEKIKNKYIHEVNSQDYSGNLSANEE